MSGQEDNGKPSAPQGVGDALTDVRFDEIARLSALAASYFHSIELAADRGDGLTVVVHVKQVAAVTREILAVVRQLAPSLNESNAQ